ncbi:MAG TPA: hypothetical protein VKV25_07635, partial [Acidimicrobiales bacterium]|nr:hypothetical protein [Acidimicrobiales bacterium]
MDLRSRWEQAVDQFAGSDPGLLRLRIAARGALSLGVAILAEYLFVQATGALQQPGHSASVAAGNHDLLLIAMLLGAMMGMATAIAVNDNTPGRLAVSLAIVPFPMTAALAFSLALGGHRSLILASFAVFLGLAGLARRWGPRGTVIGVPIFIGDLVGFFLHGVVPVSGLGWLAAEIGVGAVACLFVRLVLFRPDPADELRRAQRSWAARARTVARLAAEATASAAPGRAAAPTAEQRLRRQLARLNEASLIIDAHLAEPGAVRPGSSARQLHDRLFEAELGITNTARFAVALAGEPLEADARAEVDAALACLREGDTAGAAEVGHRIFDRLAATAADDLAGRGGQLRSALRRRRVLLHRFATSVTLLGDSLRDWELVGG